MEVEQHASNMTTSCHIHLVRICLCWPSGSLAPSVLFVNLITVYAFSQHGNSGTIICICLCIFSVSCIEGFPRRARNSITDERHGSALSTCRFHHCTKIQCSLANCCPVTLITGPCIHPTLVLFEKLSFTHTHTHGFGAI